MLINEKTDKAISEWFNVSIDERDATAKDLVIDLLMCVEHAATMALRPAFQKAYVMNLYRQWKRFCKETEIDDPNIDGNVERYSDALFGSAIVALNDGAGAVFVKQNKILWSKDGVELFTSWLLPVDESESV